VSPDDARKVALAQQKASSISLAQWRDHGIGSAQGHLSLRPDGPPASEFRPVVRRSCAEARRAQISSVSNHSWSEETTQSTAQHSRLGMHQPSAVEDSRVTHRPLYSFLFSSGPGVSASLHNRPPDSLIAWRLDVQSSPAACQTLHVKVGSIAVLDTRPPFPGVRDNPLCFILSAARQVW